MVWVAIVGIAITWEAAVGEAGGWEMIPRALAAPEGGGNLGSGDRGSNNSLEAAIGEALH